MLELNPQADNVLNNDLEKVELEELSGVAGLKALRVGVNLEDPQEKKVALQGCQPCKSIYTLKWNEKIPWGPCFTPFHYGA
jgi:hypothetical protein